MYLSGVPKIFVVTYSFGSQRARGCQAGGGAFTAKYADFTYTSVHISSAHSSMAPVGRTGGPSDDPGMSGAGGAGGGAATKAAAAAADDFGAGSLVPVIGLGRAMGSMLNAGMGVGKTIAESLQQLPYELGAGRSKVVRTHAQRERHVVELNQSWISIDYSSIDSGALKVEATSPSTVLLQYQCACSDEEDTTASSSRGGSGSGNGSGSSGGHGGGSGGGRSERSSAGPTGAGGATGVAPGTEMRLTVSCASLCSAEHWVSMLRNEAKLRPFAVRAGSAISHSRTYTSAVSPTSATSVPAPSPVATAAKTASLLDRQQQEEEEEDKEEEEAANNGSDEGSYRARGFVEAASISFDLSQLAPAILPVPGPPDLEKLEGGRTGKGGRGSRSGSRPRFAFADPATLLSLRCALLHSVLRTRCVPAWLTDPRSAHVRRWVTAECDVYILLYIVKIGRETDGRPHTDPHALAPPTRRPSPPHAHTIPFFFKMKVLRAKHRNRNSTFGSWHIV